MGIEAEIRRLNIALDIDIVNGKYTLEEWVRIEAEEGEGGCVAAMDEDGYWHIYPWLSSHPKEPLKWGSGGRCIGYGPLDIKVDWLYSQIRLG